MIAATNKNLREAVKEGAFRQDLYFRLNVIQILIPPLRERAEDILPLTKFFIEHYNRKFKRSIEGVTDEAARLLLAHDWPGNVRELRNAIERAMILEETALITPPACRSRSRGRTAPGRERHVRRPISRPTACRWKTTSGSLLVRALEKTAATDPGRAPAAHHPRYAALQDEEVQPAVVSSATSRPPSTIPPPPHRSHSRLKREAERDHRRTATHSTADCKSVVR